MRNTYPIIIQIASCALILLLFGFMPKPEVSSSEEKKPFRIPSITGFIEPVKVKEVKEKSELRQKEIQVFDAIVQ